MHAGFWGTRHTFALMAFLGMANTFTLRVNLSVAIVAMVNASKQKIFYIDGRQKPEFIHVYVQASGGDDSAVERGGQTEDQNGQGGSENGAGLE